jgi:hypothetical protein
VANVIEPELKRRGMLRNPRVEARVRRAQELIAQGLPTYRVAREVASMGCSERHARRSVKCALMKMGAYDAQIGEKEQFRQQLIAMAFETRAKALGRTKLVPCGARAIEHPDPDAASATKAERTLMLLVGLDGPAARDAAKEAPANRTPLTADDVAAALRKHYFGVDSTGQANPAPQLAPEFYKHYQGTPRLLANVIDATPPPVPPPPPAFGSAMAGTNSAPDDGASNSNHEE